MSSSIVFFVVVILTISAIESSALLVACGLCPNSHPEKDAGLCYKSCRSGYKGVGPVCWHNCPSGFTDIGAFCQKPSSYGRGAGYPWKFGDPLNNKNQFKRCESDHGSGNCELNGLIVYPKCRSGYHNVGCCVCSMNCPSGWSDTGTGCTKPSYGRGVGVLKKCKLTSTSITRCIRDALKNTSAKYGGTISKHVSSAINDVTKTTCNIASELSLLPFDFLSNLVKSCNVDTGTTVYFGQNLIASDVLGSSGAIGMALAGDGGQGCFFTGCVGGGATAEISTSAFIGILTSKSIDSFKGTSTELEVDVELGEGIGLTASTTGDGTVAMQVAFSLGVGTSLGALYECSSSVIRYNG